MSLNLPFFKRHILKSGLGTGPWEKADTEHLKKGTLYQNSIYELKTDF